MMKRTIALILASCFSLLLFAQDNSREKYIDKYKKIAVEEMERSGVPASIKLAQGILESNAGKSTLARKANNHFGMKCGSAWRGKEYYLEDDDYDANGNLIKSCFRVYRNAKASYIAHSEFLRDPAKRYRYGFLFDLDPKDYRAWARGLKSAGYATSRTYAEKLIRVIETYKLYRFDEAGLSEPTYDLDDLVVEAEEEIKEDENSGVLTLNNVKFIRAEAGDTPLDIGLRTNVPVKRLLKYNDQLSLPTQNIKEETPIFIQRKRCGYRGRKKWHLVKEGETMFSISQKYAIRLDRLHKRNRVKKGREPRPGEMVKIRGWKVRKSKAPGTRVIDELEKEERIESGEIEVAPPKPADEIDFLEEEIEVIDEEETFDPFDEHLPKDEPVYHQVAKGETLYRIARLYEVTVAQIKELNNLSSSIISPGQTLRIK
ncbi:MAG: glucosaminidase domain-containing protein [Bacteroidota bacterium]